MNTLILTGYAGDEHGRMAEHTVPLMLRYANRHGAAFECRHLAGPRPPSWLKVPALYNALDAFDAVLWLDVDVVIADSSRSIFDEVGEAEFVSQALVEHQTECGLVPNCGVWLVTPLIRPFLHAIWEERRNIEHPWWEQASVLEQMGYAVDGVLSTPGERTSLLEQTKFLSPEWNHHPQDKRRTPLPDARFVHVTQWADRLEWIKELAGSAA